MEVFDCATKIVSGAGAVAHLKSFGAQRLFLVTDPFFYQNGTAQRIAAASAAPAVEIFHRIRPDPTVELAAEATAKLKSFGPDLIVALGGGSTMDCAKAMAFFGRGEAKLVAVPTTSGSGSEVTDFAILTHNKVKHPLVDRRLRPHTAILDSELLQELPASLVAETGFDLLTHAVEAFAATGAGTFSDMLAQEAFRSAYGALPASYAGRQAVRLKIHQASTMAGLAFTQAGLGLCHAMAHALGGLFHVPHGQLNAVLLPAVIASNAHVAAAKYAQLARCCGMGSTTDTIAVRNLRSNLVRLRRELQLPETLAQAGIAPGALRSATAELVAATLGDPCCKTNPMKPEPFLVRRILEEVTGRV